MNLTKDEYNVLMDVLLSEKQTCMIGKNYPVNMECSDYFEARKQIVEKIINKIKGEINEN